MDPHPADRRDLPRPAPPLDWSARVAAVRARFGWRLLVVVGGVALVVVVAGATVLLRLTPNSVAPEDQLPVAQPEAAPSALASAGPPAGSQGSGTVVVADIAGAVRKPGLYRLAVGARVADLVHAAGGLTADADRARVRLAALVRDGDHVVVPREGEPGGDEAAGSAPSGPLDLNTATAEQLDALPGIGPATAQAIVEDRARNGPFRTVDDLARVRGIGPAKVEALRDLVTV